MTVCRGCCCGTRRKHPDVDHDRQLDILRAAGSVRVSDCLNACDRSNVVVVQPAVLARRLGARPVWLGGVLDETALSIVVDWIAAGGPGLAAPPDRLAGLRFAAPRWGKSAPTS
ncbi:hypothetical protein ACN27J_03605 [Solwaraspora sp. WMMB762]|uniref:hypothetical protein n=1 Tax=Solwaraspora sp. WMMB762 TaxID=3404120 RepID=UPI003B9416DD